MYLSLANEIYRLDRAAGLAKDNAAALPNGAAANVVAIDAAKANEAPISETGWTEAINLILRYRPIDHLNYLERFWAAATEGDRPYWMLPDERRSMAEPMSALSPKDKTPERPAVPGVRHNPTVATQSPRWKHLIYPFMVENTRIVEVFRRVLVEMVNGERLGRPNYPVMAWRRATEELFFSDRTSHWLHPPLSQLRPDAGAVRRNAYYRMFGIDLSHGYDDGRPYPYVKAEAANRDFVPTFELLLREVWRGYMNRANRVGPNLTDDATLADLCRRLKAMMEARRINGELAREEFYCDAMLSWLHLTVAANNEVVNWLQAQGGEPSQRLAAIADRVGLPANSRSYEYLRMAEPLAEIVFRIERGDFNSAADVPELYGSMDTDELKGRQEDNKTASKMATIINCWSAATGRNLKEYVSPEALIRPAAARRDAPTLPAGQVYVHGTGVLTATPARLNGR